VTKLFFQKTNMLEVQYGINFILYIPITVKVHIIQDM